MSPGLNIPFRRTHGPLVIQPEEIVVFDDEVPAAFTLYLRQGDGFTGARHVATGNLLFALGVVRSWGMHAPITDRRNDRSIPLKARRLEVA